jgi:hypothetical protein
MQYAPKTYLTLHADRVPLSLGCETPQENQPKTCVTSQRGVNGLWSVRSPIMQFDANAGEE